MGSLFGTDGVRGVANTDLTPELALKLGRASACYFSRENSRPVFLVGRDTRISGDMLEAAFSAGVCSIGGDVVKTGIVPTPAVAWLTRAMGYQAGVMISASHNPIGDNGIKLFSRDGFKLDDTVEEGIERLVEAPDSEFPKPVGHALGKVIPFSDDSGKPENVYIEHVVSALGADLTGMKIVLDCAFGAAWSIAPLVFKRLGAEIITLNSEPDGQRINVDCGSTNLEHIRRVTIEKEADLGLAFDGDADRCLAVDEKGNTVDGDRIMMILAQYLLKRDELANNLVVATVMSNLGFEHALRDLGIKLLRAPVGDRYVLREMKQSGAIIGGEQSGHIILLKHNTTGDGVATALFLSRIVKEQGRSLYKLASLMSQYPQRLLNVKVQNRDSWDSDNDIARVIREMEELLGSRGRILVRPSGTEPLIRVMAEGSDEGEVREVVDKIAAVIKEKLG